MVLFFAESLWSAPVAFTFSVFRSRLLSDDRRHLRSYTSDPVSHVFHRAMDTLTRVTADADVTLYYVSTHLAPLDAHLQAVRALVPRMIANSRRVLEAVTSDQRSRDEIERNYASLQLQLPQLLEQLAAFSLEHVITFDHVLRDVTLLEPEVNVFGRARNVRSLFWELQLARFVSASRVTSALHDVTVLVKKHTAEETAVHLTSEADYFR